MQLEADIELRLRHLGGDPGAKGPDCAAAQLVQVPGKETVESWELEGLRSNKFGYVPIVF